LRITELLYRLQLEEFEEHYARLLSRPGTVWVSALVLCPTRWRLMLRFPELAKADFRGSYALGRAAHLGVEQLLRDHAQDLGFSKVETEVEVERRVTVDGASVLLSGRVDALGLSGGGRTVIEVKTARGDYGLPHEHHLLQLRIYMWMLGASRGVLLYLTPDRVAEYEVGEPLSEGEVADLVRGFLRGEPSPRYDWECGYCPYAPLCPRKRVRGR